jgi:hypothetical protein
VLHQTALAENILVQIVDKIETDYDDDSPEHITLQPTFGEELIKEVFEKIEAASAEAQGQEKEVNK